ncbi:NUDIX hydrolase [Limimaricola variabilis]|jgi:8-oxo-dGTP pyrophosphatase MutT (NUDIX family)|uniref:NUDIX hydrolase n=1 Tax=Limimaricola variabilis TaxID=1492771 RepID=UPI002AC989E5|nr:NUDIX hydrolase [Limimaricola variabilis]WPY95850.1 NUDIX hydrolase [Limimaricola variabilis]
MIQHPLRVAKRHQRMGRTQFAALPWRVAGDSIEICLITSRGRGRWILPKGWPMDGATPAEAAAAEAREEAGLVGQPEDRCLGIWSYVKGSGRSGRPHFAMVFPVRVTQVLADWPERGERRRKWFTREAAAAKLSAPELRQMVLGFDPAPQRPRMTEADPPPAS